MGNFKEPRKEPVILVVSNKKLSVILAQLKHILYLQLTMAELYTILTLKEGYVHAMLYLKYSSM